MQFDGALIREQGVTFAVVIVKQHVLQCTNQRALTGASRPDSQDRDAP